MSLHETGCTAGRWSLGFVCLKSERGFTVNQCDEMLLDGAHDPACNDAFDGPTRGVGGATCAHAKAVALRVLGEELLAGKVFLMGGLVPWIVSGQDSGRLYSDVDLAVRAKDMPAVRA